MEFYFPELFCVYDQSDDGMGLYTVNKNVVA
jgi:hypothetical protein